jgi:nucleoside-diphosphate-sugar epimerase
MKVLVTGATGFVGTHLCELLLKEGHEVFALARNPDKLKKQITLKEDAPLVIIKGDLDQDQLGWVASLPLDLDACVHTAGIVHSYKTDDFFRVNTTGTTSLVNSLKARFDKLHFVLVSSLAAAGPALGMDKKTEIDLDFPVSIYGRSKKDAETSLRKIAPPAWSISIIRPPMVIGPRDSAVLDIFKMVQSGVILLPGINSKEKLYSFVCVFDLIETISKMLEYKKAGIFYSAHPQTITFLELIMEIKSQLKNKWIIFLPMPLFFIRLISNLLNFIYRFWHHSQRLTPDKYYELAAINWTCDANKSEAELSQVYHYDLSRTVSVTLLDYKERKWI